MLSIKITNIHVFFCVYRNFRLLISISVYVKSRKKRIKYSILWIKKIYCFSVISSNKWNFFAHNIKLRHLVEWTKTQRNGCIKKKRVIHIWFCLNWLQIQINVHMLIEKLWTRILVDLTKLIFLFKIVVFCFILYTYVGKLLQFLSTV